MLPKSPRSRPRGNRLFNEAEQVAVDEDAGDDGDLVDLPDTGLQPVDKPEGKKRGRRPLPTIGRPAPAVGIICIAWEKPSQSSSISR